MVTEVTKAPNLADNPINTGMGAQRKRLLFVLWDNYFFLKIMSRDTSGWYVMP